MTYGRAFFDLQLEFARKVSVFSGMALARTLLEYTNLYVRLGLGRDFDADHPTWQAYLAGLQRSSDQGEWTHRFYAARSRAVPPPGLLATFGCFSYARLSADRIRLHFHNAETDGRSPLETSRRDQRLTDLVTLFAHVKRTEQGPLRVVGASWLYNIHAYRRLFPRPYLASAHVMLGRFQHLPLWGQFVDRFGTVKRNVANELLERLKRQSSLENLDRCFPLQVLALEAPARCFFEHHGV